MGLGIWGSGFLLAAIAITLYSNVLGAPFVFDDDHAIVVNEQIRHLSTSLSPTEQGSPLAGRPLVSLTFAVNYALGELDPRGYRLVNVAIHALNALLLFAIARRLLHPNTAFAIALLWMVHPLATEPVDYVSQRTELMIASFFLATVHFGGSAGTRHLAARGTRPTNDPSRPSRPSSPSRLSSPSRPTRLTASVVCCALGMACKETMVVAPVIVLLYDRTFAFGSFHEAFRAKGRYYAALCATWIVLAALLWSSPRGDSAGFAGASVSPWEYLLNQCPMIVRYLRLAFWPRGLVLDYGEPMHVSVADVAPYLAVVAGLLVATAVALARKPRIGFLGAWFFLTLAPTSSIVPISTEVGAERRMYLPLMAIVVLAVMVVVRGFEGAKVRRWFEGAEVRGFGGSLVRRVALVVAVVLLAVATYQRNGEYRSGLTLWQTVLDRWPPHARAHRNLAAELKLAHRPEEEIQHLRAAANDLPEIRNLLGLELLAQGRNADAATELRIYLRDHPRDADAWANLGNALSALAQQDEAMRAFRTAVDINPNNGLSQRNLALAYLDRSDFTQAATHAREAVRLTPADAAGHNLLGLALIGEQRLDEAVAEFRTSLALQPANNDASGYLERTLKAAGR